MTETTTRKHAVIDITDLQSHESFFEHAGIYKVLRSDSPLCVYKALNLEDKEKWNLYLTIDKKGLWNKTIEITRASLYEFTQLHWYENSTRGTLNLLVPEYTVLSPVSRRPDRWANLAAHIEITNPANGPDSKLLSVEIPWEFKKPENTKLIVENDEFFVNILGFNFLLRNFEKEVEKVGSKKDQILKTYSAMKSLPVKFTKETFELYLGQRMKDEDFEVQDVKGISKAYEKIKPYFEKMIVERPALAFVFRLFLTGIGSTIENVSISTLFNKIFANAESESQFRDIVERMTNVMIKADSYNFFSQIMANLEEAREMKKAALKRKATGAVNKIMDDLDFVHIDPEKCPLTYDAVHSGELPIGTFFRKSGESYFVYNDNWSLWEEMLAKFPDVAKSLASEAARRTTYEKDLMSYFYFVLHRLPEYLERHTGKKWESVPKLVTSANELEPPKEGSNGVAKTRSALTPVVDNENCVVTVPYVSMKISGYQTTYCYGLDFNVLQKGMSWEGNVVTEETEKLNGRDAYGLMFYTLTGSATGRGYPTFLIIFEEVKDGIRVHFHRTHPLRSKQGDDNPIHNWIKGCYKWMIGNVNYERIRAQQGDLAFVEIEEFPKEEVTEVNSYDNHCFGNPVRFTPYNKKDKQNVLGYVQILEDTVLNHTEHLTRKIPAGNYEIRQCRSWEANPKGIWSLRID